MAVIKRARLAIAIGLVFAPVLSVAQTSHAASSYFCYQSGAAYFYQPYQDCWGGTARALMDTWVYTYARSGCASYAPYYGAPFSTAREYNCTGDVTGWNFIWYLDCNPSGCNQGTRWGVPLNHNQGVAASHHGWYNWT